MPISARRPLLTTNLMSVVASSMLMVLPAACAAGESGTTSSGSSATSGSSSTTGNASGSTGAPVAATGSDNAAAPSSATGASRVLLKTSLGSMTIELYADKAPITVKNFLQYVDDGFFNGTIFHRVIGNFMIQGGGFTEDMTQKKTRDPITLEAQNGLKNDRGWVAMARTGDPNSATAQFFINTVDNASLNYPKPDGNGYAVFGKVVEGLETLDKIAQVRTGTRGMFRDVPAETVRIESATRVTP